MVQVRSPEAFLLHSPISLYYHAEHAFDRWGMPKIRKLAVNFGVPCVVVWQRVLQHQSEDPTGGS